MTHETFFFLMCIGAYILSILLCLLLGAIVEGNLISNIQYEFSGFINKLKSEKTEILDPNGILKEPTMNIEANEGHKVKVTEKSIERGYDHNIEKAKKFLEVEKIYTIESIWVGDWSSTVKLQEIPNEEFNSVHFIDAE